MRKRFFLLLMAAVMAIVLIPLSPIAAEDTINYDHDYNNDGTNDSWDVSADGNGSVYAYLTQNDGGSTYTLTVAGTGAMKDYYQYNASSSDGRTAAPWMETYGESITAVDIKDGVTKVGSFAFAMCTKLEEATYPENCVLTRSCFKGTALTEITVYPGNISTEEGVDCSYVFMGDAGTSKLENVTFAEGVTSIPNYYLDWAFNLESLTIPSTVTEIGRGAFRGAGNHTTNGVSVTSHTGSIDWINGYDNYFKSGTQDTDAKVAAISGTIPAVEMTLPVDANFSLFSGISGYSYSSSDTSVVSVSDHTATTQAEGTATVTGSKAGSGSTITYNITVTNEPQIISTWDDLMRAFQYGGSYILANSISYDPGVYTHNDNGILNADGVTVEINLGGHTLSTSNITRLFGTSETDGANKGSIALSNGTIKADVPTGDNVDTATLTITRGSDDSFTAENVTFEIGNRQYLVHADNGGTVELKDCSVTGATTALVRANNASANVTIEGVNYAGQPVSGSGGSYNVTYVIEEETTINGPITIGEGVTYILNGGSIIGNVTVNNGGSLAVESGSITGDITVNTNGELTVNDGAIKGSVITSGTTTITGGTFTDEERNSDNGVIHVTGGTFEMSGGTVTARGAKARAISIDESEGINAKISGGSFDGTNIALLVRATDPTASNSEISVTGGTFISKTEDGNSSIAVIIDRKGVISQNLGVYDSMNETSVTLNGSDQYTTTNEDGTLRVLPNPSAGKQIVPYTAKEAQRLVNGAKNPVGTAGYTFVGWFAEQECNGTTTCGVLSDPEDTELVYALFLKDATGVIPQSKTSQGSYTLNKTSYTTPALGHQYQYAGYDDTITESCKLGCDHTATATISAPTENLTYDSQEKAATVNYSDGWQGGELTVSYSSSSTPTNAGTYTASISVGEQSASVEYTIAKASSDISISAASASLTGGGTVTLSVTGLPDGASATVTCSDSSIVISGSGSTFTATLPNSTATYTFTAFYNGDTNHEEDSATCEVKVTQQQTTEPENPGSGDEPGSDTPSDYNYPVTVKDADNGTVTIAKEDQWANDGEKITVTVTPDDAYMLDKLVITDKAGNELEFVDNGDGTYTFTMPKGAVTITATFVEDPNWEEPTEPEEPSEPALPFSDVREGDWFYDVVKYVYNEGLMTGTSATTFEPNTTTTRGMIVSILHRLEGSPVVTGSDFTDVNDSDWYGQAVAWAAENGIVNGFEDSTFRPNAAITREQMAAILYNYADYKGYDVTNRANLDAYSDADQISSWASDVVAWANAEGLINGMTANTLEPQGNATRAQVAAIFQRFLAE